VQHKTKDHGRTASGLLNWKEISKYADTITIMCYNYSSRNSKPGPLCPVFWLKDIINFAKTQIPLEKICIALTIHGYDWSKNSATSVNSKKANELIKKYNADLLWDHKSLAPYFKYSDAEGIRHEVWFENQKSLLDKIEVIKDYKINNIAIWHLGILDPSLSESLEQFLN
jgi:spore germination protein YaaH